MHTISHGVFYSSTALTSKIGGMESETLLRRAYGLRERWTLHFEKRDCVQQRAQRAKVSQIYSRLWRCIPEQSQAICFYHQKASVSLHSGAVTEFINLISVFFINTHKTCENLKWKPITPLYSVAQMRSEVSVDNLVWKITHFCIYGNNIYIIFPTCF